MYQSAVVKMDHFHQMNSLRVHNLKYQNQLLTLTTGIGYNIFSTDKTLETEWDKMVMKFLKQHDIDFEEN